MEKQQPLVSVPIIVYNSSKTIVETLESIYNQTYPNIELIISDDCSTDNTIYLCKEWINNRRDRFVNTEILTVEKNTGTSANVNRAEKRCMGEWIKNISGDDKLLPNCITDFIEYAQGHPEAKYIFGKMTFFDGDESIYDELRCDYNFFKLPIEEQLHKLIYEGNCIQAPTSFYNREYINQLKFRHDERIPLIEDYPKWIRLLQLGVRFYFVDKDVVAYRVGNGVSTQRVPSLRYYRSQVLCDLYYRYPIMLENNKEDGINRIADDFCEQYKNRLEVNRLKHTKAYRIGKAILKPYNLLKRLIK